MTDIGVHVPNTAGNRSVKAQPPLSILQCPKCVEEGRAGVFEGFLRTCPFDDALLVIEYIPEPVEHLPIPPAVPIRIPVQPSTLIASVLVLCPFCLYRYMRTSPRCPLCKRDNPEYGGVGLGKVAP